MVFFTKDGKNNFSSASWHRLTNVLKSGGKNPSCKILWTCKG